MSDAEDKPPIQGTGIDHPVKLLLNEIRDLLECAGYGAVEVYTIVYASERQSAVTIKWCDGNYMKYFSPDESFHSALAWARTVPTTYESRIGPWFRDVARTEEKPE